MRPVTFTYNPVDPGMAEPQTIYIHPLYSSNINFGEPVTVTLIPASGYVINPNPTKYSATLTVDDYFSTISTNVFTLVALLNNPQGIDYDPCNNSLIASVNVNSGYPFNFEQLSINSSGDTVSNQWSSVTNLVGEMNLAVVAAPNASGFAYGAIYYPQEQGVIGCMSADGQQVTNTWVTLPNETLVSGLCFDRSGNLGGDLIAVTSGQRAFPATNGGVWRVTANGAATKLANLPYVLEGVITLTNDAAAVAKFGPWAGKIITGSKDQQTIYAIDANGTVTEYPLGIEAEDFDLIPANQNLYCAIPYASNGELLKVSSTLLTNYVGDLLITQAGDIHAGSPETLHR